MTCSTTRPSAPPARPDLWGLLDLYWAIAALVVEANLQLPAAIAAESLRLAALRSELRLR